MSNENAFTSAEGKPGRMIGVRLSKGCDLVQSIIDACRRHGVKSGGIMNILGSLTEVEYSSIAADPNTATGAGFSDQKVEGPVEFLSGQGLICEQDGEMFIHLHGVMSDVHHRVFGGHIERGNCKVANTFELIILEGIGFQFSREYDEETGFIVGFPRKS